jgi:hypothetical protein
MFRIIMFMTWLITSYWSVLEPLVEGETTRPPPFMPIVERIRVRVFRDEILCSASMPAQFGERKKKKPKRHAEVLKKLLKWGISLSRRQKKHRCRKPV